MLEHGPDLSLDSVVNFGVEEEHPAQNIRATSRKVCANRALNVPRTKAFGWGEGRRYDGMTKPVGYSTGWKTAAKKEPYKIVASLSVLEKARNLT